MGNKKPHQRLKTKRPGMKATRKVNQKNKKVVVTDKTIAKLWDDKETVKRNFAKLGLAPNSNRVAKNDTLAAPTDVVKELEKQASWKYEPTRFQNKTEQSFAEECVAKYGSDYKAMAKDRKLNIHQHNENQLRKKCEKYLETMALQTAHEKDKAK